MLLSSLLEPELVRTKVKASHRDEVVELLLRAMFEKHQLQLDFEEVLGAIKARDALGGTILPTGLAIPHARIDLFDDILIALATLKTPLDVEGMEVRMVVLILTSKTTSNLYLNCLSAFARLSQNHEVEGRLNAAQTSGEIIQAIQHAAVEVKKELTVRHIMSHDTWHVAPEDSVARLIDAFLEYGTGYMPVLEDGERLVGECSIQDVLRLGIPNYARIIGNLGFLKTFEPLEELLEKEQSILVKDLMVVNQDAVDPQTSLVELVSLFTRSPRTHVPVLEGKKLVGMVSYMDVVKKVLRA